MRRTAGVILLLIAVLLGYDATATQYAFRVSFYDKNTTPFSLSTPSAYLSARALARRTTQGIAIDSTDIPVNASYIDSVLTLTGGEMHEVSKWFNYCVILLADSATIHVLDGKSYIKGTKLVAFYTGTLHKPSTNGGNMPATQAKTTTGAADAPYYGQTWVQTSIVNGNYLYDKMYTGAGKLIAVIDAGYTTADTHPGFADLWSSGRVVDQHNFTLASGFVLSYDSHGMKVLSEMAGYVPNTFVGSAPMASYALYVSEDGGSEQPIELLNMVSASERADSIGADIITTSLGYNLFDNPANNLVFATDLDGKTTAAAMAANMATSKGILFVASAGNEGGNSWNSILTPGDADSALTIGSVDPSGIPAPNSGYGPNAAGQVKPDVCGMGQPANIFNTSAGYGIESGTSFATPQIAGWAACLWQSLPGATPYVIKQAIIKCASAYNAPTTHIGYGIPDFQCATDLLLYVQSTPTGLTPQWIAASPIPFVNELRINVAPDTDGYVDLSMMDLTGRTIATMHRKFYKGFNAPVTFSLAALPSGIYVLNAISATKHQVIRLEKL
jgi:serine protease AprX